MHVMADALMKYETIDAKQIDEIMEGKTPSAPESWTDDDNSDPKDDGSTAKKESSTTTTPTS
jgi:cell division protease FtsH